MKWKKQLCAAAAVLLALGIALAGVLLNQHFLVLSGGISRTEMQSPLGDLVRSHLQLVALIVFATLAAAILALYHYKKQPELRYFLLYLAVLFFWGTLAAFFPAGFQGLLQRFMRLFFAITILASALLSAALLALPLPAKWVVPASAVFLLLGQVRLPILRFGTLTAGMCLCLYLLLSAYLRGYEAAGLLLFPCAITTGFRVWALLPTLPFYVECYPLYLLRCARVFDIPFALGCMTYVCRRFALQFDRTEQLAQELDTRVIERTRALTEETEARKSMMLNIFHDLRSPLFAVSNGLDTLAEAPDALPALLPALQQRVAFGPQSDGRPLSGGQARAEAGAAQCGPVALNEATAAVCAACQSEAAQKGVTLRAETDCFLPVWGDNVRLQQVVQNLVTNAIHYTPAGGVVTVTCAREGGTARVTVQDTGCGIAPEDQAAVFDRYFHTTANTKHDSTGLGLTIAQELAHLHHGEITLQSEVGKGSRFTLKLPILE